MIERIRFTELNLKYCAEYDPEFVGADDLDKITGRLLKVWHDLKFGDEDGDVSHAINQLEVILDDVGAIYDKERREE